ncbi:MAG: aldo/keto reductase [Puniceicoccaceae bacterium]|nr:MAG: aldo/keto reductase [Puniceicoccaceae bacterium]
MNTTSLTRRSALRLIAGGAAALAFTPPRLLASSPAPHAKPIPSSGEMLPVIGLGTWRTFNVGADARALENTTAVMKAFFNAGGGMIDCSPMYGSAREVLGHGFEQIGIPETLFSAEKVWIRDGRRTAEQINESLQLWGVDHFDLVQVHNLLSWEPHLENLRRLKGEGKVRYLGITTSHGRRHDDVEAILRSEDIDFLQLTYNITHPEAERRLLPLAADRGVAVIANRPFDGGGLIRRLKSGNYPLPSWAAEIDCSNWAEFLLKFIVSHPHVTCAIPATSRVEHLRENMGGGLGRMPDEAMRRRMADHVRAL